MKSFTYKLCKEGGIHARPAGAIALVARGFESDVVVRLGGEGERAEADGKRLLSLMTLGAREGDEVTFLINGRDEESAADALLRVCREALG
jgi:phosphocarrier protein